MSGEKDKDGVEHCWCGGVIEIDSEGKKRCSNADPNEVGP